jgi:hypothetical protein
MPYVICKNPYSKSSGLLNSTGLESTLVLFSFLIKLETIALILYFLTISLRIKLLSPCCLKLV